MVLQPPSLSDSGRKLHLDVYNQRNLFSVQAMENYGQFSFTSAHLSLKTPAAGFLLLFNGVVERDCSLVFSEWIAYTNESFILELIFLIEPQRFDRTQCDYENLPGMTRRRSYSGFFSVVFYEQSVIRWPL